MLSFFLPSFVVFYNIVFLVIIIIIFFFFACGGGAHNLVSLFPETRVSFRSSFRFFSL